jgi:peptidyl-prolyl cis-trans isomerase A (cyclophilin A)
MKRNAVVVGVVVVLLGVAGAIYAVQPSRLTASQLEKSLAAQKQIDQIEARRQVAQQAAATEKPAAAAPAEAKPAPAPPADAKPADAKPADAQQKETPVSDVTKVKFECSNGTFVVECYKDWAPLGVERFLQLVKEGFFADVRFFRVVTQPRPFVVQFGISGDPATAKKWRDARIKDDPVKQSNKAGTLTFATGGPNTRTTQLFVNLGDNTFLDQSGFSPIGKVVEGLETVKAFNSKYQDQPTGLQGQIQAQGNAFLEKQFPGLDYIKSATIVQ